MYAITTPDGSAIHRIIDAPLPGGSTDFAAHGVLAVIADPEPQIDAATQYLSHGYELRAGHVAKVWVVHELSAPMEVTRRQLFLWLNGEGISRAACRAQLELIEDPVAREAALIEFDEAMDFRRDHPLIQQLAVLLGYNAADVESAFREASQL